MEIARLIPNICSTKLVESREFYTRLLDLGVTFDSDWYVQMASAEGSGLELGILRQDHDLIPEAFQNSPQGLYLTFVVDDVDAVYANAQAMNLEIVQPPTDEFYGQRRLLITDPNGLLLDISAPIRS